LRAISGEKATENLAIETVNEICIYLFKKHPIKANASFKDQQNRIIISTLNRYKSLAREELDIIENMKLSFMKNQ
jgi:hypothetical protein